MANYRRRKNVSVATLVATILGILLAASIVLGVGYNLGWFDKSDDVDDTDIVETDDTESTETQDSSADVVYEFEVQ